MFFTTLLIIAPNCKQFKYPSARMKTNGTSARVSRPPECSLQTFQYTLPNNHMEPKKLNKNWGHICKTPFLQNSEYKLIHRDRKQITTDLKMWGQETRRDLKREDKRAWRLFRVRKVPPWQWKMVSWVQWYVTAHPKAHFKYMLRTTCQGHIHWGTVTITV